MKVKIGDNVRFLNEEGGGKVSRIDGRTIYVEDADGFEMPVMENDVVVVSAADAKAQAEAQRTGRTSKPQGGKQQKKIVDDEEEDDDIVIPAPVRKNGQKDEAAETAPRYSYDADATDDSDPHFAIALTRTDGGNTGTLDLHVVNDSNYFASYAILRVDAKGQANVISAATVEPNTKEKIDTLNPQQVDGQTWRVQLIMYKKYRTYSPQPVYDVELKPKGVKLFRDGSFVENDYFDEKAVVMHIIKDELAEKIDQLKDKDLRKGASEGRRPEPAKKSVKANAQGIIEVDLHIEEILEDTRGLDNKDMLKAQTDHFRTIMEQNINKKGQRIVFIHGVGQGVLKNEILRLLRKDFAKCAVQDASFAEYGFGATMVTI